MLAFRAGLRPRIHGRTPSVIPFKSSAARFRVSPVRKDVFFVAAPGVKQALLEVTRALLLLLPFAWRYKLRHRFPGTWRMLWRVPLISVCLVLALGLDQSQTTARWRLLLMSEREELEWSKARFDELLSSDAEWVVGPRDPRVEPIKRVCTRLVQTLQDQSAVSCALFPRDEVVERLKEREEARKNKNKRASRNSVEPSARTETVMPFVPETSNPEKLFPARQWDLYLIDSPKINAWVLPSTEIFVYSGLLEVVEDEDPKQTENMLAAVLAHELSHVTERHAVESLGFFALSGVVFDILRGASWALTLSFPYVGDGLATMFNFIDRNLGRKAYSRKLEMEADSLGLQLMAKSGYDPRAALLLWTILAELESSAAELVERHHQHLTNFERHSGILGQVSLLRTHPTGEQRIESIKKQLPAAIKLYEQAIKDREAAAAANKSPAPASK